MPQSPLRHRTRTFAIAVAALAFPVAASAAPRPVDGTTAANAAASCWEVKQQFPASADGVYWLMTPKLQRPDQFYCDMTTDGGGWVLVGRGRNGWRSEYEGQGTAVEVRTNVTGPSAFTPRQLHGETIDGLLNGGRVDALTEGVRLRRATNAAGTTWQETRFNFASRDRWTWAFRARHRTRSVTFDGVGIADGFLSNNFGSDNLFRRVVTDITAAQAYNGGFGFGSSLAGTNDASTYLWSNTNGIGFARPFTQVFIRPRLTTDGLTYAAPPDTGTPAIERIPLAESKARPTVWGVSGLASNGGQSTELRSEVQDFAQIGDYMYVGGNFRYVQRDGAGTGQVEQSYLAAFNVHTGEWLSTFRPVFNNQIKSLVALPNGTLAVGGEFTLVNGVASTGLVALNPTDGTTTPGFTAVVENRLTGDIVSVRSLKVQGEWLYLGGAITHVTGGSSPYARYMRGAGRINATTGLPDPNWNPNLNGTVNEITPSADGTRVYAAGYFTSSNGLLQRKLAAISSAPGAALIPWTPSFSVPAAQSNTFQFTVSEANTQVWAGGSEHSFFSYDKSTLNLTSGNITNPGGDFQTSVVSGNLAYAGCHCDGFVYTQATVYPYPAVFSQGEMIGFVGAWDANTGQHLPDFAPILNARAGYGAWSTAVDSTGALWMGGSFDSSVNQNGQTQWSGGFIRFAERDHAAPATPSGLAASVTPTTVNLTWAGSGESNLTYEVLVDDRVIDTTSGLSLSLPRPLTATRYFVRAADRAGNRSASTPVLTVDPDSTPVETTVLERTAPWRWRYDTAAVAGWQLPAFDDATWQTGAAPLGFGSAAITSNITVGAPTPRPLAAQFRSTFAVADPAQLDELRLSFIADDGVIVYVNGVEVSRRNLPAGTIGQGTYATAAPRNTVAEANLVSVTIPASALVAGTNVIAAETHLNYRSTPDSTFHLTAKTFG